MTIENKEKKKPLPVETAPNVAMYVATTKPSEVL
jgi:hypothetical protein